MTGRDSKLTHNGLLAHCVHHNTVSASCLQRHAESSVALRNGKRRRSGKVIHGSYLQSGILLTLLRSLISHHALNHKLAYRLCHRIRNGEKQRTEYSEGKQ